MTQAAADVEQVVEGILTESLGLSAVEYKAYRFLTAHETATASQVARTTQQSRGRVYGVLRTLVEKGLVHEVPTRPIQYRPVDLTDVVAGTMADSAQKVRVLGEVLGELRRRRSQADRVPGDPTRAVDFFLITGRRATRNEAARMVSHAVSSVRIVGDAFLPERLVGSPALTAELRRAIERGVNVEVWFPAAAASMRTQRDLGDRIGPERLRSLADGVDPVLVQVVTDAEALVTVPQPIDGAAAKGEDVGIRTTSSAFVASLADAVSRLTGRPTLVARDQGSGTLDVEDGGSRWREVLAEAEVEVVGLGGQGWADLLEEDWQQTIGLYASGRARGVRFRSVVQDVPADRDRIKLFAAIWTTRMAPWVPFLAFVVDRKTLLVRHEPMDGSAPGTVRISEDSNEVASFLRVFERLWDGAKARESLDDVKP